MLFWQDPRRCFIEDKDDGLSDAKEADDEDAEVEIEPRGDVGY